MGRLVLTRCEGESVDLSVNGTPIGSVRVGDVRGDKVRMVFDLPPSVTVDRREVTESKAESKAKNTQETAR